MKNSSKTKLLGLDLFLARHLCHSRKTLEKECGKKLQMRVQWRSKRLQVDELIIPSGDLFIQLQVHEIILVLLFEMYSVFPTVISSLN